MWVRHDVRMTPPPKDIMAEKTATVLWNNWLKKFLKPGPVLLLSFSSSPIELLPGAVDRPRSEQLESQTQTQNTKCVQVTLPGSNIFKKCSIKIDNSYNNLTMHQI